MKAAAIAGHVSEPPTPNNGLIAKLAQVMAIVERIPKRGHNEHFHYDFATESDITGAIRAEMAGRALMMVPNVESISWRETAKSQICCLMVRFTIYDGDSGDTISFVVPGEGQDSGDKAVPKALTSALKYACLKLFLIPTGDDPEREAAERAGQSKGPAQKSRPGAFSRIPSVDPAIIRPSRVIPDAELKALPAGDALILEVKPAFAPMLAELALSTGEVLPLFREPQRALAAKACAEVLPVRITTALGKKSGKPYVSNLVIVRPVQNTDADNARIDEEIALDEMAKQAGRIF
jgi:hypothetical protein